MRRIITSVILPLLASGCAFADTAKLGVLVLDEETCLPIEGAKVRGGFRVRAGGLSVVKGAPLPNVCFSVTDRNGRCKIEGETNCGHAGAAVEEVPQGYYCPLYGEGHGFTNKNLFGVWQPDNLVITLRVQRVENPIPLFVKRIGRKVPTGWSKDIFPEGSDTLRFDFMKGDFLPPVGNGVVADVEFIRLPHQDFGEGVNAGGYKGNSYRNSMEVRFTGEDNGIVEVARPSSSARLKVRTAPETGFNPRHLCWHGRDKHLKYESNRDEGKCFCFRIRTRRNERGEIVEGYYGKIYGEIFFCGEHKEDKTYIPVASVSMLYYLNPNNLDRNLEWNKQNLCEDPIYPIPQRSRRQEYKSFNREQMP